MKTFLFISLFVLQFTAQSQEYVGMKFKDLLYNNDGNPDKRYNMDSMEYSSTGCKDLLFRFFYSTKCEKRTMGTSVFYGVSDSIITRQVYHYSNGDTSYVMQELIRLSSKGYKTKLYRFKETEIMLEIKR